MWFFVLGGFFLVIEGFFKIEIKCVDNGDGICIVGYVFIVSGEYNVSVKFVDSYIVGFFFIVKISRKFFYLERDFS